MSDTLKVKFEEAPSIPQHPEFLGGDFDGEEQYENGLNGHTINGDTVSAEDAERKRFEQVDQLLSEKAADFYGMRVLAATEHARFRIFDKAAWKVQPVDEETHRWRKGFEAGPAIDTGGDYLKKALQYQDSKGERQVIRAGAAFQRPEVAESVYAALRAIKDAPMHIVDYLRAWPDTQLEKPSPEVARVADQALVKLLFSVHGASIALHIQQFLAQEAAVEAARASVEEASTPSTSVR